MRKLAVLLLWIAASMGCWFLFVATSSSHELWLAVAFTALTVFLSALAWRHMPVTFSPTFKQAITLWRLPWYVLSGSWEMFTILLKDIAGRHPGSFFRRTPFQTADGPEGDAQAVLATAYTTVAPNFIVIGISKGQLLFHQVEKSEVPRMIRDIEAQR
ncbi:MAG TPA: hypothetical protein VFW25_09245 [Silvibacterium sp.]|nr:hypothetical protein [Silvibacterium sp.]